MEDNKNRSVSIEATKLWVTIFMLGCGIKVIQFARLWPTLSNMEELYKFGSLTAMQLLPTEILIAKPLTALLYLQQSPPLPNAIHAVIARFFFDNIARVPVVMAAQGFVSAATAAFLALLIFEWRLPKKVAVVLALIYLTSTDLLLMEYHDFGYLLHENMSMLFCTVLAWAGLKFAARPSLFFAILIGSTVALLALTRSTFSYLGILILFWMWIPKYENKTKHVVAYLLPLLLLQGGWVLKNYWIYDYWSISTSSWGGLNLLHGERARNGGAFYEWLEKHAPICAQPFNDAAKTIPIPFGFAPNWEGVRDLPGPVRLRDEEVAAKLGKYWGLNTVATREWSQCQQRQIGIYWQEHPEQFLSGFIKSWCTFWLPIRQFAVVFPIPLTINSPLYSYERLHFFELILHSVQNPHNDLRIFSPFHPENSVSIDKLTLPVIPDIFSALSGLLLHSLPLMLIAALLLRRNIPCGRAQFLLLGIVGYIAVLTSVVECCENMRFRLAVEPIIWCLAIEIARQWWQLLLSLLSRMKLRG